MGRPPCCDKVGIKKGPWTPEEDIILVSYIQEHGPGNWRSVPTNTGLSRCSKSCRLRWTNYLRPGIKRGNFTPHEEGMIIHLQALLGNKWAAIASYLPQRTDNDIKNYWNTHLKKKLKKFQAGLMDSNNNFGPPSSSSETTTTLPNPSSSSSSSSSLFASNISFHDRTNLSHSHSASSSSSSSSSSSTTYASSTENISRLLQGWMMRSSSSSSTPSSLLKPEISKDKQILHHQNDSSNKKNILQEFDSSMLSSFDDDNDDDKQRSDINSNGSDPPLLFLEKWLFEESNVGHEDMMELSPMF